MALSKRQLDEFYSAYVEAALFTGTDESDESGGEPLDKNYGPSDFSNEAKAVMRRDANNFANKYADLIEGDIERAGHDFWLTRNGHGSGFWDGDWPEPDATTLTDAAEAYGEQNVYLGDDGEIYVSGGRAPSMQSNPNRPPKHWFQDCVAGASESADDPNAVCGALWYHKMSPAQRRAATAREESKDNPGGAAAVVVLSAVALGGLFWWLTRDSGKPAEGSQPSPGPGPLPPAPPPCTIDHAKLVQWAAQNGVLVVPLLTTDAAPSLTTLAALPGIQAVVTQAQNAGTPIVVVLKDGSFWGYDAAGTPQLDAPHRASYCQFQGTPVPVMKNVSSLTSLKGPPRTWLP